MCFSFTANASNTVIEPEIDPIVAFDEVSVEFYVSGYYRFETNVIITDTKKIYINIDDLFNKLGIYCKVEDGGNILKGFIENEKKKYRINLNSRQIKVGNKIIKSKELDLLSRYTLSTKLSSSGLLISYPKICDRPVIPGLIL